MKNLIAALMASAALAACSGANDSADAPVQDQAAQSAPAATILADLGGESTGPVYTKSLGETLALSGYDAVSYFGEGGPVEGSAAFTVLYQGYAYRFANADNAAAFQADATKYLPQYGGYCAWAMGANNALAPGDPKLYKIVDGKLYLNFSPSVQERWEKDIPGFIAKGDVNFPAHDASEHYTND